MPQLSIHPASWVSFAYHSNATRIIAFSFSCIVVTSQLGAALSFLIGEYIDMTALEVKIPSREIIKPLGFIIAFIGLVPRYSWIVWRQNSSIPRGVDLVLHTGEMGLVLWRWETFLPLLVPYDATPLSDFCTICLLFIPSALFLLVAKILDVVSFDGGMWLGLQAATRIMQQDNKSHVDRMSLIHSRLIIARLYLILIIVHTVGLVVFMRSTEEDLALIPSTYSVFVILELVSLSVSLVHHLLSFFVVWFLPRGLDFGLLLLETLLLSFGGVANLFVPWIAVTVITVSERLLISLLLAFRIWDIVKYGAQALEPFNLAPKYDIRSSRIALILGRNAWENLSLRGEPVIVKSLRGILATAALVGLATFSVFLISRDVSSSQNEVTLKNFVLSNPLSLSTTHYIFLTPAEGISPSILIDHPEIIQITQTCSAADVAYNCSVCYVPWSHNYSCWDCLDLDTSPSTACQVQIQADFGRGAEIGAFAGPDYNQVLYVRLAFNEVDDIAFRKMPKVTLRRNRALEGDLVFYQYEFMKKSGLTSFGFESSNQVIVGDVKSISNDPTYAIPNNLSYLKYRYSPLESVSTGVREYTDRTVLDALASIGGIWTFGNGLFTVLFGGSLLYFLFGFRPLSRLGFVHLFIRDRLRQTTWEQYPNFHREGGQPGEAEAGVVSFIRQHLLGVVEDDEEEKERKKRRREWERQRDEMELLSFEVVSGPLQSSSRRASSGRYESLVQDDLDRPR